MADDVTTGTDASAPVVTTGEPKAWEPNFREMKDTATVSTFDGKKLPNPLVFDYTWREFGDERTLVFSKKEMSLKEQMDQRNADEKLSARQKAQQIAFKNAGLEKDTAETSDKVRAVDLIKNLMTVKAADKVSRKYDWESAKAKVLDNLDIEWNDDWGTSFAEFEKKPKK